MATQRSFTLLPWDIWNALECFWQVERIQIIRYMMVSCGQRYLFVLISLWRPKPTIFNFRIIVWSVQATARLQKANFECSNCWKSLGRVSKFRIVVEIYRCTKPFNLGVKVCTRVSSRLLNAWNGSINFYTFRNHKRSCKCLSGFFFKQKLSKVLSSEETIIKT